MTFDLTGLPPTHQEVEQFVRAAGSNRNAAIAQLIDRLLDSPRYGECWGRHWLDVARYSDTKGYVFTAGPRTLEEPGNFEIREGMHLRMNGPKKLMSEIKAHEGSTMTGSSKRCWQATNSHRQTRR